MGTPYAVQLIGRGSCEPYFRFTALRGALPPGISFSSGGLLSGTPARAGSWRFWVRAQDLRAPDGGPEWCISADQADGEFVITVHPGVVVTTEVAAPGTVGTPYALALSAQTTSGPSQLSLLPGCAPGELASGSCPLAWSIAQGQLPAGFRLNPVTGQIWGTPTAEGAFSFVVRAALDDGRAGTRSLTIAVRQPLSIDARAPFAARASTLWEVGVPFAARLVATGGASRYSWSLAGGALPPGLAVAADGTVAGTPRAAGPFRATIQLEDDEGRTAAFPAVFRVAARLAISTAALRPGKVGRVYRARLAATGGLVPRRWRAVSGSLPRGIRLDRSRGLLTGTPTRAGRYRVTFEVSDKLGVKSTRSLVIDIRA